MEKDNTSASYLYEKVNQRWHELPIDNGAYTFLEFANASGKLQKKLTTRQLETAILHLKYTKDPGYLDVPLPEGINPIYDSIHARSTLASKDDKSPLSFYWETQDLMLALLIAFSKNTYLKNDNLAEQALYELGILLGEKNEADVSTNLITQKLLADPYIQKSMVSSFEADLESRMRAIWEITHQLPGGILGHTMMDTLKKLDNILLELMDLRDKQNAQLLFLPPDRTEGAPKTSTDTAYQIFERLYSNVLSSRNAMRISSAVDPAPETAHLKSLEQRDEDLLFSLPSSQTNDAIIQQIQTLLEKFNRKNKKAVQTEFEDVYKAYLLGREGTPSLAQSTTQFLRDYQRLDIYAHHPSIRAEFIERFRQELYLFARDIFDSVQKSYMDFRHVLDHIFTSAYDSFAYGRLASIHQHIWQVINNPIWLLRITEVFKAIYVDSKPHKNNELMEFVRTFRMELLNIFTLPQITQLHAAVRGTRLYLHGSYPDVPMLSSNAPDAIERFIEAYNKICGSVYHLCQVTPKDIQEYLFSSQQTSTQPENRFLSLLSETILMEMECKILVATLIDEAVYDIHSEHNKLNSLFNK